MKKLIMLLLFATLAVQLKAQETPDVSMTFNHVALSVKNVDVSAEFYKQMLNLPEIDNRSETEGIRWFSLGEGKELHLIAIVKGDVVVNKAIHFALTTTEFDAFIANLQSRYMVYTSWDGEDNKISQRADGVKQVYIQDPDGYWIEVNSVAQQ